MDVEDYDKLSPEHAERATALYHACVRKARWATFGYAVEEGVTGVVLSFYEPLDAVMFCLMAQQVWRLGWGSGCIRKWMDGWVGERVRRWVDAWMDGWVDRWMDGWMDGGRGGLGER
eukprot:86938-Chlamydomonas_euryale.AAC.1